MPSNPGFEFAACTDAGLVRAQNEDALAVSPAHGIALLADGMGGYNAGEVASGIAVRTMLQALQDGLAQRRAPSILRLQRPQPCRPLLDAAVRRANAAILDAAAAAPQYSGMGTTVVAALLQPHTITIAHVGDSRAYRLRGGELTQLTRDHSLLQEQIDAGLITPEAAREAPGRNLVTRAVGVAPQVDVEIHAHRLQPGDLYLLCSDGLSDMVPPEELPQLLAAPASLDDAAAALIRRANDCGGHDNISAILIRVPHVPAPPRGMLGRMFGWMS